MPNLSSNIDTCKGWNSPKNEDIGKGKQDWIDLVMI